MTLSCSAYCLAALVGVVATQAESRVPSVPAAELAADPARDGFEEVVRPVDDLLASLEALMLQQAAGSLPGSPPGSPESAGLENAEVGNSPSFQPSLPVPLVDRLQHGSEEAPDFSQFAKVMGWNFTRGLFSAENVGPFVTGSGATMVALPFDEDLSVALAEGNDWVGSSGNVIGSAATLAATAGALVLITPFTENQKFKSFSFTLAQAGILDSALVSVLKLTVPRERPNGENDTSFPSFHASSTTTVATVVQHYYGWKWGIPAYAVAGFVSFSRIESERHYLSDVIFGATVGYISAFTAIRGTDRSVARRRLAVVPIIGNQRRGVAVHLEF